MGVNRTSIPFHLNFFLSNPLTTRLKVKLRTHHDIAHIHPPTHVTANLQDMAWTRLKQSGSGSLWQGQRLNQDYPITQHKYIPTIVQTTYEHPKTHGFWDTTHIRCFLLPALLPTKPNAIAENNTHTTFKVFQRLWGNTYKYS